MNPLKLAFVCLAVLVFGCSTARKQSPKKVKNQQVLRPVPDHFDSWKRIENQYFSFWVPDSFEKTDAHGIDSFVEEFKAPGFELIFDYGPYCNYFSDWPKDTTFESVTVDSWKARIGTAKRQSGSFIYMTQIGGQDRTNNFLTMSIRCESKNNLTVAKTIFETIGFKP